MDISMGNMVDISMGNRVVISGFIVLMLEGGVTGGGITVLTSLDVYCS